MTGNVVHPAVDSWGTQTKPTTEQLLALFKALDAKDSGRQKIADQLLTEWNAAKAKLVEVALVEMELRKAVVATRPFAEGVKEGTQRIPLANGWELKVVLKQNYKLDKEKTGEVLDDWEKAAAKDAAEHMRRKLIADRLVKFSPDLSISEYRLLSPEDKKVIDKVLTITDGAPTLELVNPDDKKKK